MELLDKLRPKTLKKVVGNKIQISHFLEVLKDENFPRRIVLLIGPDGCGKSLITKLAVKECGFSPLDVQKEHQSSKELSQTIKTFISNKTIASFFDKNKKIIVLDNIDVLLTTDRNVMSIIEDVYDLLEKHKMFMIITCKSNEEKKIMDMKNKVEPIKINYPSIKDCFAHLSHMKDEHEIDVDDDRLLTLVNKYKGSIRDVIMNLYLDDDEFESIAAFKDMTQFEVVKKLCRKHHTLDDILNFIKDDVGMVPYLLYENVVDEMYNNFDFRGSKNGLLKAYESINDCYIHSSQVEGHMYENTEWQFYELVQILKLYGVNATLQALKRKACPKDVKYRFSQMISKISHKNIMNKKVKSVLHNNAEISLVDAVYFADKISKGKVATSSSKKSKKYDMDESNFITTYQKYFE
jgi:hypothetical protein